jgi:hypothetical protein
MAHFYPIKREPMAFGLATDDFYATYFLRTFP